jgi:hypothetical protein
MPLIYLPLIMYAGWMEFMLQPLRNAPVASEAPPRTRPSCAETREASA